MLTHCPVTPLTEPIIVDYLETRYPSTRAPRRNRVLSTTQTTLSFSNTSPNGRPVPAWKRLGIKLKSADHNQATAAILDDKENQDGQDELDASSDADSDGLFVRESKPRRATKPAPKRPPPPTVILSDSDEEPVVKPATKAYLSRTAGKTLARPRRSTTRLSYVERAGSEVEYMDVEDDSDASVFSEKEMGVESEESEDDLELDVAASSADEDANSSTALNLDDIVTDDDEDLVPVVKKPAYAGKSRSSTAPLKAGKYVDRSLPPVSNIEDAFADMAKNALGLGLDEALKELQKRPINVATMCSGTESPLIALQLLSKALERDGHSPIVVNHHFSAEIEPVKQGFIERNFRPKKLFRDVCEMIPDTAETATTAYGAEVPIPGELDMLIAGFVCKDLSRLNSRQKGLEEGGESGDTWSAVYNYTKRFRPSIVLIENVVNVKSFWNTFEEKWSKIGYTSKWLYRDTKNYYLPQTRLRMYMIAIDKTQYGDDGEEAALAAERWGEILQKLERQTSSPFESWIIDDDSTYSHISRPNEVDWSLCSLRHDRLRSNDRLGSKRPITHWSENGSSRPPDFANRLWYSAQSTRIYDCIDISYLQSAQIYRYDPHYKMMVWDVSQNADRYNWTLGLLPCITPSGIDFIPSRHSALTGTQLLLLQGMPNDKLLFAGETQRDIQDLAGNAMSTTVIGAATVAALISARRSFRETTKYETVPDMDAADIHMERKARFIEAESTEKVTLLPPDVEAIDVTELMEDSKYSARLCHCEGSKNISKSPIQVCGQCGHTACSSCAGNPKHAYEHNATIARDLRRRPTDFEQKWRPRLPALLKVDNFPDLKTLAPETATKECQSFARRVSEADINSERYSIRDFQRLEGHWKVCYSASQSRLELEIYPDKAQWYIYVKCPASAPEDSPLRKALGHPIARGKVTESNSCSILEPEWEVYIPSAQSVTLSMTGSSQRSSSWRSRLGLLDYREETVPSRIEVGGIEDTAGTYTLLPHCGTAMYSLYKRSQDDGTPLYLFQDPDPVGPSELDSFVFAPEHRRMPYEATRHISAELDPAWLPWSIVAGGSTTKVSATIPGSWVSVKIGMLPEMLPVTAIIPSASAVSAGSLGDCDQAVIVLDAKVAAPLDVTTFAGYSWALESAKLQPSFSEWAVHKCPDTGCGCAPSMPKILWSVNDDGEANAHEDRKSAALFERALKTRLPILDIRATASPEDTDIQIGFNVASLIHRARGRLPKSADCTTAWRLITDHVDSAWEPFEKFRLHPTEGAPYSGPLRLKLELDEAQKKSLAWMWQQEAGVPLTVTEVEEDVHAELGWRAEAQAQTDLIVRGGVLADLPSFGKTVTTIGLIHSEFEQMEPEQIVEQNRLLDNSGLIDVAATLIVCPPTIAKQWREEFHTFLGPNKYREYKILLVETFDQFLELTVKHIQEARVVILSWRVFTDERYVAYLARFTAVPEPVTTRGRAFDAWLDYIVEQVPGRIQELQSGPAKFEDNTDHVLKTRLDQPEFRANVPLKVFHGIAYQNAKQAKANKATKAKPKTVVKKTFARKPLDAKSNWTAYQGPVLQMFRFNRVVVDEYHYLFDTLNYPAYSAAKRIAAVTHKRWLLSGTPALSSFSDVNQIASLLGATLGRDVFRKATTKFEQKLMDDQTDVEKFVSRTEIMSYQWHRERHRRAQIFLDQFVRQNEPQLGHITRTELLKPVELNVAHYAVYLELAQHLVAQKISVKKIKGGDKRSDKTERLSASLNNAETAEEALQKSALHFETAEGQSGLDILLQKRQLQIDQTKLELFSLISKGEFYERKTKTSDADYHALKQGIITGENLLGDREAGETMRRIIKKAKQNTQVDPPANPIKASTEMRRLTSTLSGLARELTLRVRSLRFIKSIQNLLQTDQNASRTCDSSSCSGCTTSQLFLTSDCGHLACQACLEARPDGSESCTVKDCSVSVHGANLIPVSVLGSLSAESNEDTGRSHGKKMDEVCNLIKQLPEDDQAIVFVPNEDTMDLMVGAFNSHAIKNAAVSAATKKDSAATIEDFKANTDMKKRKKVLILNLADETAAGM